MKKLFVLFLLVSLVPFMVGCSLFGDDGDDGEIAMTTLTTSVNLPNLLVAPANMRAAKVSYLKLYVKIGGITFRPAGTPEYLPDSNSWKVTFQATMTLPEAATLRTQSGAAIEVVDETNAAAPVVLVAAKVNISMASGVTTVPAIVVTLTGGNKLQIVSFDGGTASITENEQKDLPATITTFEVAGVVATSGVTLEKEGGAYQTIATITAPVFTVEFAKAYAEGTVVTNLRWVIRVENVTKDAAFTLDSSVAADKALFTLAANGAERTKIDITVIGNSTKKLEANCQYKVTFVDTDLTTADDDVLKQVTYLFKTPAN